tara:strand:- start:2373 stop:5294 length:2922 start_codon:yes stop_codon:yes gene_type:complete
MSQTKAQLIQPIGVVTASGVVVSGVMTAATFDGDIVGSATSIIQGTNLNLGAFNATSFAGDFTGNATGIITSSAIKVGQLTASSFVGDFTGTATSMARGTGFEAGAVTSTAANVTYTVTVGSKTGGGNAFYLDGVEAPVITLYPGATYTFDQADSTNGTHPLRLATAADAAGSTEYTDGVTVNGTQGTAGAYTRIVVARNAPTPLYYYCSNHGGMGNSINITNKLQGAVTGDVTGSATGIAGTVVQGTNIHVGVVTATSLYGDGSNLTGIAATNFNTQTVTINSSTTTIDLSAGNIITIDQETSTTVSFANTSEAMDITLIRPGGGGNYNISYSTGGVTFDGTDDGLSMATDSDWQWGTGAWTVEFWMKTSTSNAGWTFFNRSSVQDSGLRMKVASGVIDWNEQVDGNDVVTEGSTAVDDNAWHHVALCRGASGDQTKLYIDGKLDATGVANRNWDNTNTVYIGRRGTYNSGAPFFNGILSNYRVNKGNAVYTGAFVPPSSALTNISGTVFLALQSTTDATAATVIPTGSITAESSPTAGAQTIARSGTYPTQGTITWPSGVRWNGSGVAPTLFTSDTATAAQQFQLLTRDSGVTWYGWEPYNNEAKNWSLFVWGINQSGNLGLNTPSNSNVSSPTQIPGTTWSRLTTSVGNGGHHSVLKSDGTLWMWGSSAQGKLGNNTGPGNNRSSPIQVPGTTWKTVNHGSQSSLATKTDGTLWSWGYNFGGVLGQNQSSGGYSSPTQVGTNTTWATGEYQLTAGVVSCGAIKTDGTLWSWGYNEYGTLGHNNKTEYSSPKQVGTNTNWRSVAQHYYGGVMMATKTDGTLWAWGSNAEGGLGQNDTTQYSSPRQIPGTNWNEVTPYGGWLCTVVTKTDGTLWAWGNNDNGTAGQNNNNDGYSSPTQIPGTTWKKCMTGDNGSAMGLKTDGTMWAWGINQTGVLGLNQTADNVKLSSPTQIPGTWHSVNLNGVATFALKST